MVGFFSEINAAMEFPGRKFFYLRKMDCRSLDLRGFDLNKNKVDPLPIYLFKTYGFILFIEWANALVPPTPFHLEFW